MSKYLLHDSDIIKLKGHHGQKLWYVLKKQGKSTEENRTQ